MHEAHPKLEFRIISGNGEDIAGGLANGTIDLALFVGLGRYEEFDYLELPYYPPAEQVAKAGIDFGFEPSPLPS